MDPIAIDTWMHPWLPLLGNSLDALHAVIRQKLSHALQVSVSTCWNPHIILYVIANFMNALVYGKLSQEWNPSDISAYAMLMPWANVFAPAHMEAMLVRLEEECVCSDLIAVVDGTFLVVVLLLAAVRCDASCPSSSM